MTTTDDTLYQMMHDLGDHKVRRRIQELRDRGMFISTAPGARLAAEAGEKLVEALRKYLRTRTREGPSKRTKQLLKQLGVNRSAAVALRLLVNRCADRTGDSMSVSRTRAALAKRLEMEAEFGVLSKIDPTRYRFMASDLAVMRHSSKARVIKRFKTENRDHPDMLDWDKEDRYMLAALLIDLAVRHCEIFETRRSRIYRDGDARTRARHSIIIQFREDVFDWITEGINLIAEYSPIYLPITTPPIDWDADGVGGYPESRVPGVRFMTKATELQGKALRGSECEPMYRAVNTLQRTGWQMNEPVFDVLRTVVEHKWRDPEVVLPPPPEPTRPAKEYAKGDPDWVSYSRANRQYRVLEGRYRRDRFKLAKTFSTGEALRGLDKFFYPHQIDFRGRCYPIGAPLHYQGPDFQRGVLHFAEAKPVGDGLSWLLIHGANCYGEDKVPFEERVRWVQSNSELILKSAEDPIEHRFWTEADKPFQFLAFCREFRGVCEEGVDFKSRIPVAMDGSNNGLQIYSLLLRDSVGGAATNCLPGDTPADIYREVADVTTKRLTEIRDSGTDPRQCRWARRIIEFCKMRGLDGIPRSAVKRPVMTLPYGSTLYKCQQYLAEWYHEYVRGLDLSPEEQPFRERDAYNALNWVGKIVWEAIGAVVVKAREAMLWLRGVSDVCAAHAIHCVWTTPMGLKCQQDYVRGITKRVALKAGGMLRLNIWKYGGDVHPRKSRNGLCPNFIHSLDAAAMFHTVNIASSEGATHFQMIHDSYATHAADGPKLAKALREAFVDIFQHDWLGALRVQLQSLLPDDVTLPEPPEPGNMNITDLYQSKYFFA